MLPKTKHTITLFGLTSMLSGIGCNAADRIQKAQQPSLQQMAPFAELKNQSDGTPLVESPSVFEPPSLRGALGGTVSSTAAHSALIWQPMDLDMATLYQLRCPTSTRTMYLEAEDFSGAWPVRQPVAGFSGRGAVMPLAEDDSTVIQTPMSMTLHINQAAHYRIYVRGFEGGDTDRSWQVRINGTAYDTLFTSIYGDRFTWKLAAELDLDRSDVDIDLASLGHAEAMADAVVVTADKACDPIAVDAEWNVLEPAKADAMTFDHINARARRYSSAVTPPDGQADWLARSNALRTRVLTTLGLNPLPQEGPLNAKILGHTQMQGYRIERVTFESLPGLLVTANVYVPDGPGPFPVVLNPGGHWEDGKALATTVARAQALALQGYLALAYDPFGFGERGVDGNWHDEHYGLSLSGHSNMTIALFDSVRAIDYLVSRRDTDPTRIAVTGESGGGLNTMFLSVVDQRPKAIAPVVYMTSYREFIGTGHPHCPCSHIPGIAQYTDMGEVSGLFAPRPQIYMNAALDDNFTPAGVLHAEAEARPIYDVFGADARLGVHIFPGEHEYSQAMREMFYGFAALNLQGAANDDAIAEPAVPTIPANSPILLCFANGFVPTSQFTVHHFAEQWAVEAAGALPHPASIDLDATRTNIMAALNPPAPAGAPMVQIVGSAAVGRLHAVKVAITVEDGITIPALYVPASNPSAPVVMIVDDAGNGKQVLLNEVRNAGFSAFYVSPRGRGETAWEEYMVLTDNMLLGDSTLGQRAFDLVAARRALRQIPELAQAPVGVLALGDTAGLEAIFAQALWNEFDAVSAGPTVGTFLEAFESVGLPEPDYVGGVLNAGDVAHAAKIASAKPLRMTLRSDALSKREPEWAQELNRIGVIQPETNSTVALHWLAAHLGR